MEYILRQNFENINYDDFYNKGYQIIPDVLNEKAINQFKEKLINVYNKQLVDFDVEQIKEIGEQNTVRSPFLYDKDFYSIFYKYFILII